MLEMLLRWEEDEESSQQGTLSPGSAVRGSGDESMARHGRHAGHRGCSGCSTVQGCGQTQGLHLLQVRPERTARAWNQHKGTVEA